MTHAINQLREQCRAESTKEFRARGSIVKRCPHCFLAEFACMCQWQLTDLCNTRFIILVHKNELFKTTNTGRLIANLFPQSTSAYLWSRTEPNYKLLEEINDPQRQTALLFPEKEQINSAKPVKAEPKLDPRPHTVILLDGTWKQAARMANLSAWLKHIPRITVEPSTVNKLDTSYIRKTQHDHQLSTAQAAALILRQYNEVREASLLEHYFSVFNHHCKATRSNVPPSMTDSHHFLSKAKTNATN